MLKTLDSNNRLQLEKIRDLLFFLVTSLTRMLETAGWNVFSLEKEMDELRTKYEDVDIIDEAFCGYEVNYYYNGEDYTSIYIIPIMYKKAPSISVKVCDEIEIFPLILHSPSAQHDIFVKIHEFVKKCTKNIE